MPPAVGLGIAGAGLLGSGIAGAYGASEAANSAKNARRQAEEFFRYAQQFQPQGFYQPAVHNQRMLNDALLAQAAYFSPQGKAQSQAAQAITRQFNKGTEQQRQSLSERNASRGLFRSGIAAQQEEQYLNNRNSSLADALIGNQINYGQAANQAYGLANQQQQQLLGNQMDLYRLLLNFASGQSSAAGQQQAAAQQALGQAIGGPFSALTQLGTLGAMGGFQGFGGGGGGSPGIPYPSQAEAFYRNAGPLQQPQFGYPQPSYGFQYPGFGG